MGQLAAQRSMPFVCVQPMQISWARRAEDLTFDKTDENDAVLIARLTAQLRCYVPEPVDETWGRLRQLGARHWQLITEAGSQIQQMRDLIECVWPATLDTARSVAGRWPCQATMRWANTSTMKTTLANRDAHPRWSDPREARQQILLWAPGRSARCRFFRATRGRCQARDFRFPAR